MRSPGAYNECVARGFLRRPAAHAPAAVCVRADRTGDEKDGKDEALVPSDINLITDDDLRALLKPLEARQGVKLTFVAGAQQA